MKVGLLAGSFDPPTVGHLWLYNQAKSLVDELFVAICPSQNKPTFALQKRIEMLESCGINAHVGDLNSLINQLKQHFDEVVLISSEPVELPNVKTVYLAPPEELKDVSSTLVKNLWRMGADISPYVTKSVRQLMGQSVITGLTDYVNRLETYNKKTARSHFKQMEKAGLVHYATVITNDQVKQMLDPTLNLAHSETFRLQHFPIKQAVPTGKRQLSKSQSVGPIIIDVNTWKPELGPNLVIEGKHRWYDAKDKGESTILAWVGDQVN